MHAPEVLAHILEVEKDVMISICVLIFFALVGFIFWLGGLAEKSTYDTPAPEEGR